MIKKSFHHLTKTTERRFLLVGAYNTALSFVLANILLLIFGANNLAASLIIAYLIQLVHNFFSFEKLVFHSKINFVKGIIRLNNSYMVITLVQFCSVFLAVKYFDINRNLAYSTIMVFMVIIQYFAHKHYTFKANDLPVSDLMFDDKKEFFLPIVNFCFH